MQPRFNSGEVYVAGFGEFLYYDEAEHFFFVPKLISMPEAMASSACGQSHIITRSHTGNVYTWGAGEYGQVRSATPCHAISCCA
jgi:alpha-tubulin suppressor-like RCC1 family protein